MRQILQYPRVLSEEETLARVLSGHSIARFGDGEFKIAAGNGCVSQIADKRLQAELQEVLLLPRHRCLVAIPRLDPRSPKIENWSKYKDKYPRFLTSTKEYGSAFITRPDSAPWIFTREFYDGLRSLWRGQTVVLVSGSDRSLTPDFLMRTGATGVVHVECARRDAYAQIGELETKILNAGPDRVILCCGPTATCLAWRLSEHGVHAVDLGHVGMFWFNDEEKPKWMRSRSEKNLDSGGQ